MEPMGIGQVVPAQSGETLERARVLLGQVDPAQLLRSKQILGMMEVLQVPRNTLLIKGVVECESTSIPLMDARVDFSAGGGTSSDRASVVIVDLGGTKLGLILDPALPA